MSKSLLTTARFVGMLSLGIAALGVFGCSWDSSAEPERPKSLQVSLDCSTNAEDENVCTGHFENANFGLIAILRDDMDAPKSAYFVDIGDPFRAQNDAEGAVKAVAALTTARRHSVIGIFDLPPEISEQCQNSINSLHRMIDVNEANIMNEVLDLSVTVTADCDISRRTSTFMFDEARAVSSVLKELHINEYRVVGSSFASARWTGIAQFLDPSMLPTRLSFSSPLGYGSDLAQLIQGIEIASKDFWREPLLDACPNCFIDDLEASVGPRKWARALVGASYTAEKNREVLPRSVSRRETQEGDGEFEDTVQRLNDSVLQLDVFDEVEPSWITSLVGVCAVTTHQKRLRGYFENGKASSAGEGIGMQYLPCAGAEDAARKGRHRDWPLNMTVDIPFACQLTVLPDPVLGDGMSYKPPEIFEWRDFKYRSPVLRVDASRHGDLSLAMLGLEECPPNLTE